LATKSTFLDRAVRVQSYRREENKMANDDWTDEELRAAIEGYLEMLGKHHTGQSYVKEDYYRKLAKRFGRTEKSYVYRARNISHVLGLLGREWLPGLLPAKNVGTNVVARIENILAEVEGTTPTGEAAYENSAHVSSKKASGERPGGTAKPEPKETMSKTYQRDPEVKAWVLREAQGLCELCDASAPFVAHDDVPFLEVHHVKHLGDGGSDQVENAAALCPNCHRALHYAKDKAARKSTLYEKVGRLVLE
jgi:5-methylcytosine-specific restriction protein A